MSSLQAKRKNADTRNREMTESFLAFHKGLCYSFYVLYSLCADGRDSHADGRISAGKQPLMRQKDNGDRKIWQR